MIKRYSKKEMTRVWEDQNRYLSWLRVEIAVCEELARRGVIPRSVWAPLRRKLKALEKKGGVDPAKVEKYEQKLRHDIIAFTTAVADVVGDGSRYVHFGLTSSDVLDTALSLQVVEAGKVLLEDVNRLIRVLGDKAKQYKNLPTIGRSHGIFAEPTSFGLKFLGWKAEWIRNRERLKSALENMRYGQCSGSVGVTPHWDVGFEEKVLSRLGLKREPVSTQVIPRDRHAEFLGVLAVCGGSVERIAVELRNLQRSEVGEVVEGFKKGQKGSSAMPHKKNPISSENLTGCARLLRSYAQASFESIALWHERDISHSSVERVIFPDATILFDYALQRLTGVLESLKVDQKGVRKNLKQAGEGVFSGHVLMALVEAGAEREDAYYWVQECSQEYFRSGEKFEALLGKHSEIKKYLKPSQIRKIGSLKYQLRHVSQIYKSVKS